MYKFWAGLTRLTGLRSDVGVYNAAGSRRNCRGGIYTMGADPIVLHRVTVSVATVSIRSALFTSMGGRGLMVI